jgi:hypothetical protein
MVKKLQKMHTDVPFKKKTRHEPKNMHMAKKLVIERENLIFLL